MLTLENARANRNLRSLVAFALLGLAACSDGGKDDDKADDKDPSTEKSDVVLTPKCEAASTEACSSFISPVGTEVELGEYGSVMDPNVGVGYENPIALGDSDGGFSCQAFTLFFAQDAAQTSKLLDTKDLKFDLYTVYHPAKWLDGEKFPLVTWGNGTCAQPEGYGALLRYVASQGFIVVASNSRWVGGATEMLHGLDFMLAANEDPKSKYYHRIDADKVAAMGHSQGGMGTVNAASDPRIKTVVLFNGGSTAVKPFLSISGDMDLFTTGAADLSGPVAAAPEAAYLFYHMIPVSGSSSGHLTLMLQPERVVEPTAAWLKMQLLDDADARSYFSGANCKLCGHDAEYEFGQHGL